MSEITVCRRCGYESPADARYCAHCGRALVPSGVRFSRSMNRILDQLSPLHLSLLGLVLSIPISVFAHHLMVMELSIPLSLLPLALVLGGGYAYLGWSWRTQASGRNHLVRMLLIFVGMAALIAVVWLLDWGLLRLLSDSAHVIVYEIPGLHAESAPGYRMLTVLTGIPPYWLVVMLYGAIAAVGGYLIRRARSAGR
jgi:hypothetical protein